MQVQFDQISISPLECVWEGHVPRYRGALVHFITGGQVVAELKVPEYDPIKGDTLNLTDIEGRLEVISHDA